MLDLVVSLRQMALPLLLVVVGGPGGLGTLVLLGVILGGILTYRVVHWQRYTYRLTDSELVIQEGVLHRSRRVVPLARIQQVDIQRALRHQLFGVAVLRVDTAGGSGGAEAELDVLGLDDAQQLRALLLQRRELARAEPPPPDGPPGSPTRPPAGEEQVVLTVPTWRLAVAGITGGRLAVVLTLAASALRLLEELPDDTARGLLDRLPDTGALTALALVVALPLWFGLAAGSAILTDAGFTLTRRGSDLHVRRGLLDQREASTALHRVQAVRIQQNLLRRALGLASVQLQSAGSGASASGDVSRITVPVMPVGELPHLLEHVLPDRPALPELAPAPPAARRRAILRRAGPVTLVAAPIVAFAPTAPVVMLAVTLLALAVGTGELAWRGLGHAAPPDHVVARSGGLLRETVVVPVAKAQSTRLRSSPLQRRAGLATLLVDVAGRGSTPAIIDGRDRRLHEVRDLVLASRAALQDEATLRQRARGAPDAAVR